MEVKQNIRNELFNRHELLINLESDKAVSFDEARKKIAYQFGKEESLVDVYNIIGSFGRKKFLIRANVYDNKKDMENIKKVQLTRKERKEINKVQEEKAEEVSEKPADTAPIEEKQEQIKEKPKKKPEESPAEDRPEEEQKIIEEEKVMKEEAKEK